MATVWVRTAWAQNTAYAIGARVVNASVLVDLIPLPCVYRCAVAGTSAASGTGPDGTDPTVPITDGGVTWQFQGPLGAEVLAFAPQLSTVGALEQTSLLDLVTSTVGDDWYVSQADPARAYLAAHYATMIALKGHGFVSSEAVGALSRSYGMAPGIIGDLALTSYGAAFKRMQLGTGGMLGFTA